MAALQDAAQAGLAVAMAHPGPRWRWLLARDGSEQWVVERDGDNTMVGTGRATPPEEGVRLAELAATEVPAVHALLAYAVTVAGGEPGAVRVTERPGTLAGTALAGLLASGETEPASYYVRVPDPVALLEALRPVLGERLRAAGSGSGEFVLSFFRSHVRFEYRDGRWGRCGRVGRCRVRARSAAPGWPRTCCHTCFSGRSASPAWPPGTRTSTPVPPPSRWWQRFFHRYPLIC